MNNISIIGSGKVGFSVGTGLQQLGYGVLFYDIDESTVVRLTKLGHKATTDLKYVIDHSSLSFVCVPTLSPENVGLSRIVSVMKNLADALQVKQDYHLIVIKGTVVPTTTENILIPLLLGSGKKLGREIGICVNPEFITETTSSWTDELQFYRDFFSQDRIVIGEYDKKSGEVLEQLYQPLQKPIFRTDLRTAEMIKCVANCMLATKISFWNEIFLISQTLGVDSQQIANIVALDSRIGKYGTVHGKAFGGKCLPKDLEAFVSFAQKYYSPALLTAAKRVNDYMAENYGVRE